MTTLADFLLARIAEDEAVARKAADADAADQWGAPGNARLGERWWCEPDWGMVYRDDGQGRDNLAMWDDEGSDRLCAPPTAARHIARHDPARVLAECEAHRRIVEAATARVAGFGQWKAMEWALLPLAAVYADHPDYDERWRAHGRA